MVQNVRVIIKRGKNKREITLTPTVLEGIAISGMLVVSAISPIALGAFAAAFLASRKCKGRTMPDIFYYLKQKGYIKIERERSRNVHISLTQKGEARYQYYKLRALSVKRQSRWDKKWRIVFFDIPASDRSKRNALRSCLKRLNFHQLQKSVWINPFPCRYEVMFVKNYFKIPDSQLQFIVTDNIENQKNLERIFKLK